METPRGEYEADIVLVSTGIWAPKVQLTPNNGIYNPTTGMMTLEFATPHGLTAGTSIKIAKESLTFSCGFGGASGGLFSTGSSRRLKQDVREILVFL